MFFLDEIAKFLRACDSDAVTASQQITRCRIFCNSPHGADRAYFRLMHDPTARDPIQKLSWIDNPAQNRSMYHVVAGRPVAVEAHRYGKLPKDYRNPVWWGGLKRRLEDRGFDLSKGYRSPWYDNECLRPGANVRVDRPGTGHVLHGGHGLLPWLPSRMATPIDVARSLT